MELDAEAKAKAIDDIRSSLKGAIRMLQAKQSKEEEEDTLQKDVSSKLEKTVESLREAQKD